MDLGKRTHGDLVRALSFVLGKVAAIRERSYRNQGRTGGSKASGWGSGAVDGRCEAGRRGAVCQAMLMVLDRLGPVGE